MELSIPNEDFLMKRLVTVLLSLIVTTSCKSTRDPVESGLDLIGGQRTALYPAVGQLLDTRDGGLCTASLIGSRQVLTAAHCLEGRVAANMIFRADRDYRVTALRIHPLYKAPEKGAFHDIGLVTLASEAAIAPLPLELNNISSYAGRTVVNIGFGVTNANQGTGSGVKRQSQSRLTVVRPTTLRTEAARSNICDGDSGGPLLLVAGQSATILGVASYVDLNCARYSIYTRVDQYQGFLKGAQDSFPCGSLTEMGICEGNDLRVCVNNQEQRQDCASRNQRCDWDDRQGTYSCL
jgi:hypothetical protein